MIYIILLCLYFYLIIKALLSLLPRDNSLINSLSPKVALFEYFLIAIQIGYLFNYYYLQTSEFSEFIIGTEFIWLSFVSSILLFGIAIGSKFMLNIYHKVIPEHTEIFFEQNKQVYEVFAAIWLNLSTLMIFFSFSLMELSRPVSRVEVSTQNIYFILGLSGFLGFLFYFFHKGMHQLVRKITVFGMFLILFCLVLFTYESRTDFMANLPFTLSFIVFLILFLTALILHRSIQAIILKYLSKGKENNLSSINIDEFQSHN
jgi:hypothetical protein